MAHSQDKQFSEAIARAKSVLVTTRRDWTADGIATALALGRVLARRGTRVEIVCDSFDVAGAAKPLAFLPGADGIRSGLHQLRQFIITLDLARTKVDELSYDLDGDKLRIRIAPKDGGWDAKDVTTAHAEYKYDLAICVDTPDYAALGRPFAAHAEFFHAAPVINIDHEAANEQYGNINAVDIAATSCAEVLYALLKAEGTHFLDEDVATLLLAGIISKTKSFKTASVTPRTLDIASALVAAGGRRDQVVQHLYRTRSIATLKLWGRALARLKYDPVSKTAWSVLVRQDFIHAGTSEEHAADVIEELMMNSPEAEIVGLLYEVDAPAAPGGVGGICVLVATEKHPSATGLLHGLRPEGDRRTARLCFESVSMIDAEKRMLDAIHASLGKTKVAA